MSPFAVAVLALSMSVDAFAVCVGRGASVTRPRLSEALRTGLVFGFVEALTPVIGWCAGLAASRYVEAVDHWIAFVLLGGVGLHMIHSAFAAQEAEDVSPQRRGALVLMATALGTSIDAMAVGVCRWRSLRPILRWSRWRSALRPLSWPRGA